MNILITGDSHTGALSLGLGVLRAAGALPEDMALWVKPLGNGARLATPFFRDAGAFADITDPAYRKQFRRLPPKAGVDVLALSGALWPMRAVARLLEQGYGLAPASGTQSGTQGVQGASRLPAGAPGAEGRRLHPMSQQVFARIVLSDMAHVLHLLEIVQRSGVHALALSGPGLFRDHFAFDLAPEAAVLALFHSYRATILAALRARGIPVIDIPPDCLDKDGFMRPELRNDRPGDMHHANAAYGAEVTRQIIAWAQGSTQASSGHPQDTYST